MAYMYSSPVREAIRVRTVTRAVSAETYKSSPRLVGRLRELLSQQSVTAGSTNDGRLVLASPSGITSMSRHPFMHFLIGHV